METLSQYYRWGKQSTEGTWILRGVSVLWGSLGAPQFLNRTEVNWNSHALWQGEPEQRTCHRASVFYYLLQGQDHLLILKEEVLAALAAMCLGAVTPFSVLYASKHKPNTEYHFRETREKGKEFNALHLNAALYCSGYFHIHGFAWSLQ